jgi:hypothetical protein
MENYKTFGELWSYIVNNSNPNLIGEELNNKVAEYFGVDEKICSQDGFHSTSEIADEFIKTL